MEENNTMNWLHMARKDLDMAPFDGQGGLGKMVQLFGGRMDALLDELNDVLVA